MQLVRQVRQFARQHALFTDGEGVLVGVSGGPDSLCLLHVLCQLRQEFDLEVRAAHLNHGLRGAEAQADARFVERIAAEWGVGCTVEQSDVRALARRLRLGVEEAARQARYAFLARAAVKADSRAVAVAHNADDQAETVLMHFLRGAGLAGLRGMRPKTPMADLRLLTADPQISNPAPLRFGDYSQQSAINNLFVVRPLLATPRSEIEAYCARHGLQPRFDRSNLDTTLFRNRLRHELLPELERYNPNIRAVLRRTAEVAAGDYATLELMLDAAWRLAVIEAEDDRIVVDLDAWGSLSTGLRRGLIRRATARLRPALRDVDFTPVESAMRLADARRAGQRAPLPGDLALHVGYGSFTIAPADQRPALPDSPFLPDSDPLQLAVPGRVSLPGQPWQLVAQPSAPGRVPADLPRDDPWTAVMDASRVSDRLLVRARRPGDRFRPQGMGGQSIKLSDFMINARLPAEWRNGWPLVAGDGEVLWVCGYRVSESVAVRPGAPGWLVLRWERLPEESVC